jgi:hypothetical protein
VLDVKKVEFMKTGHLQKIFVVVAGLSLSAATLQAQAVADNNAPQAAAVASAPQLSYGASQILRLMQAKVGDDTIIAYVKNSQDSYALTADQIIYLRRQGVSDAVINVMLNRPKSSVAAAPATSAPQQTSASTVTTPSGSTATVAPVVTYVQPAPTAYYYQPYYPAYAWYPPVALSFGFGWGGGWHGGWRR